jgi:hypothetical protein
MACGNCGREGYVRDALRYGSGCKKIVVECECDTYGLVPHTWNYPSSKKEKDYFSIRA